jgi:hypothetical protein
MSNILTSTTAARDIISLLSSLGYGTIGTDLFVWKEPDGAGVRDSLITAYDTGSWKEPEIEYGYEYPTVQIKVRWKAGDQTSGRTRTLVLMNALHGYVGTVGAVNYRLIKVSNGPLDLGEDKQGRNSWAFNLEIQRS